MVIEPGHLIVQRYRVNALLGTGGMGSAFLAFDEVMGTEVAVKVLEVTGLLPSFRAEFEMLSGLIHPNILEVYDFGVEARSASRCFYYTSKYIDGERLDSFARGHRWEETLQAFVTALFGLDLLHRIGLRHGDFKPQNIVVAPNGEGVLIDLGCCERLREPPRFELSGTPAFTAPEVFEGHPADARADLFSVGVTLKGLVEGFPAPRLPEVLRFAERLTRRSVEERPADVSEVLEFFGRGNDPHVDVIAPGHAKKLLGRRKEIMVFNEHLDATIESRPSSSVFWIQGPDGVGRSRLLSEMKWVASGRMVVVEGCVGQGRAVTSMLRRATGEASLPPQMAGVIEARQRLVSQGTPTLLCLDDVHKLRTSERRLLKGLARILEPGDPILLLCTSRELPEEGISSCRVTLDPLQRRDIEEWVGAAIPGSLLPAVERLSGGFPAHLSFLLGRLSGKESSEDDLKRIFANVEGQPLTIDGDANRSVPMALGVLAIMDGEAMEGDMDALGVEQAELLSLLERGLVVRNGPRWRLLRGADATLILERLGPAATRELHRALCERYRAMLEGAFEDPLDRSDVIARWVFHLAAGERHDEAASALIGHRQECQKNPHLWIRASDEVLQTMIDREEKSPSSMGDHRTALVETALICSELHQTCGRPERALDILEKLATGEEPALSLQRCSCLFTLGEPNRALEELQKLDRGALSSEQRARAMQMESRGRIARGEYEAALELAQEAMSLPAPSKVVADLHDDIGISASYMGHIELAREHLSSAASIHHRARDRVKSLSYRALVEYRVGNSSEAAHSYQAALELAEKHGISDHIANASMNLGTAYHQNGSWGKALSFYKRGLSMAVALGARDMEVVLGFDLAKLYLDMGLSERSRQRLIQARSIGIEMDMAFMVAACDSLEGECLMVEKDLDGAIELLEKARGAFEAQGALRELAETALQLVDAELQLGDLEEAERYEDLARGALEKANAEDLASKASLARGKIFLRKDLLDQGLEHIEVSLSRARKTGQRPLEAEVEIELAKVFEAQGATALVDKHRSRAKELLERVVVSLPQTYQESFWKSKTEALGTMEQQEAVASRPMLPVELSHILEIYRRISASLDKQDVLVQSLDAAIELTGAERGFIILKGPKEELHVPVARNIDRERIGKSHLKFSRGIAMQVMKEGAAISTLDAQSDVRFKENVSIHAMRLTSVMCVPIRASTGIIGALYLDNRFRRGIFGHDDETLLSAFADQVAIAINNAKLHDELKQRTEELENERRRVAELAAGQAQEITRLSQALEVKQSVLEYQYDYSTFIGRSAPMERLLTKLDRLTSSDVTVLVSGESGTGKELVARALHWNGPRKDHPFIAVNCAALTESLLEGELFGYVRGAFTGAIRDRRGLFLEASGGSLFLDEVGEMAPSMQAKLLRVLEQRKVRPVGGSTETPIDVRIVCATNRNLQQEVTAGRFREDLFYRIAVVGVELPPLRERKEDIPALARHFLERFAQEEHTDPVALAPSALRLLLAYNWPGNVRQLENVLKRAMLFRSDKVIQANAIELESSAFPSFPEPQSFDAEEVQQLQAMLRASRWNVSKVSRDLGIPRATLYRKLRRYGLRRERIRARRDSSE